MHVVSSTENVHQFSGAVITKNLIIPRWHLISALSVGVSIPLISLI